MSPPKSIVFTLVLSLLNLLAGALLASDSGQLPIVRKPLPDKLVVLTFDDGCASHSTIVAPMLRKLNFGATFYVTSFGLNGKGKDWYLTWEQMKTMSDAGFEIGNHTYGHVQGADMGPFLEMEKQFSANGVPRTETVCWPMYSANAKIFPDLAENGYLFGRGGHERPYCPEVDHPLDIPSFTIGESHTVTHFIQRVRQAAPGRVVVLTFHGVPDKEHPWVSVEPTLFGKMMEYLKQNGYTCISMRDLADYVDPAEARKLAPTKGNVKLDKTELASEPVPMALSEIVEFGGVWGVNILRKGENIELINVHGVDVTSIKPTIIVSPGATVVPGSQEPVDLSTPKTFVVTASDRTTTKYTVSIRPK